MQGIEFEAEKDDTASSSSQHREPFQRSSMMTQWLMRLGIVDVATANYILLGIAGLFFGIAVFIYAGMIGKPSIDHIAKERAILIMQHSRQ